MSRQGDAAGRPVSTESSIRTSAGNLGLSATSNCPCNTADGCAAANSPFSPLVTCHHKQVQVLLKVVFPCNALLHARVIICNARVTSLLHSSVDRRPLPPCPLLFSFKTKQKCKQRIQRMFFLPTKEISGASSKTLANAPGPGCNVQHFALAQPHHWKMCHNLSGSSWEQLGAGLGQCLPSSVLGRDADPKQKAKEGF